MDYYATGHHLHDKFRKKDVNQHLEKGFEDQSMGQLIAECYIGFQKLLSDELKAFDLKDSIFFDTMKN
jgi:hypothetical protein